MNDWVFLTVYHFIFWGSWYRNPWKLCTSEIASLWFPYLRYSKGRVLYEDPIYFTHPASMPVLSSFYFPQNILSFLTQKMSLDTAFRVFSYFLFSHYLLASFIAYNSLGLFGAITLTYSAYCIKPQTPSFVFTACWIPGMLIGGWFGAFSCFMAIVGGYWPILVYVMPVMAVVNPWCLLGVIPALLQIIPFSTYWNKSVRSGEKVDRNFGKLPWWKLKDLVWPTNLVGLTNGVHYPEVAMYVGIAPLFIWHLSWWWIPLFCSLLIVLGILFSIQRIPSRAIYLLSFSIAFLASLNLPEASYLYKSLILFQAFLLLRNSSIYPSFPFSQWWKRPSEMFKTAPLINCWPYFTGYIQGKQIDTYRGSFRLKEVSA